MLWRTLKALALELLHADPRYQGETEASLERWILDTGYAGGRAPHRQTRDLIYVYAASLRNSGGVGPLFEPFAEMVAAAADGFIVDNVVRPMTLAELAQRCGAHLDLPGSRALARASKVDYRDQLRRMADGVDLASRPTLQLCLRSVVDFIGFLGNEHSGSAASYHAAFAGACNAERPNPFVVERFADIEAFPGIGVALGMNFIKDSQVPAFRDDSLDSMFRRQVGWFVKPDKHVLRLMLHLTGRLDAAGIARAELYNLADADAIRAYARVAPIGWGGRYVLNGDASSDRGKWRCVEDVHRIAIAERVAPLGIDRLLYLVGSGRYRDPARPLSLSQEARYRRFIDAVDGWRGRPRPAP